jgi:hypothetical protein
MQTTGCFVAAGTALAALSATFQAASGTAAAQQHNVKSTAMNDEQPQISKATARWLATCFNNSLVGADYVRSAVRTLSVPGADEVRAVMQQRLGQELQQLQQVVAAAQGALARNSNAGAADGAGGASMHGGTTSSSSSSSTSSSTEELTEMLPGLGARLVACGEALAALCPVPLCCNNPGCVELRGASELQLVAGKGSVCSRCR